VTALLIVTIVLALAWWLLRPLAKRRRRRGAAASDWPGARQRHLRSFRTTGGVETAVYEVEVPHHSLYGRLFGWWCDCGVASEGPCYEHRQDALREAIGHHERHTARGHRR
jgi:hypothetical protein